jgi:hypothetical protein
MLADKRTKVRFFVSPLIANPLTAMAILKIRWHFISLLLADHRLAVLISEPPTSDTYIHYIPLYYILEHDIKSQDKKIIQKVTKFWSAGNTVWLSKQ